MADYARMIRGWKPASILGLLLVCLSTFIAATGAKPPLPGYVTTEQSQAAVAQAAARVVALDARVAELLVQLEGANAPPFELPVFDPTFMQKTPVGATCLKTKLPNGYRYEIRVPAEHRSKDLGFIVHHAKLVSEPPSVYTGQEAAAVYQGPDLTMVAWIEDGTGELWDGYLGLGRWDTPHNAALCVANSAPGGWYFNPYQGIQRKTTWPERLIVEVRAGPPGTNPTALLPSRLKKHSLAWRDNGAVEMVFCHRSDGGYEPADAAITKLLADPVGYRRQGVIVWDPSRRYDKPHGPYTYSGSPMIAIGGEADTLAEIQRAAEIAKGAGLWLGVTWRLWDSGELNPRALPPPAYFDAQAEWCLTHGIEGAYLDSSGGVALADIVGAARRGMRIIPEAEGGKATRLMAAARPLLGHTAGKWRLEQYSVGTWLYGVTPLCFVDGAGMTEDLARAVPKDHGVVVGGGWGWTIGPRQ